MKSSPNKLLIGISGFLETERRNSGIEDILWAVASEVEHVAVARFMWNDSLVTMQRLILRMVEKWPEIAINLLGYSYGGTTAVSAGYKISSLPIANTFLIDPVWRPFRHFPSFLSVYGVGTLWVNRNVDRCHIWRQRTTAIRGCKVQMLSQHTKVTEDVLNYRHTKIDNSVQIKGAIVERMRDDSKREA